MLYYVAITCISLVCEPMPASPGVFVSYNSCRHAAIAVAKAWTPFNGAYSITCQRAI